MRPILSSTYDQANTTKTDCQDAKTNLKVKSKSAKERRLEVRQHTSNRDTSCRGLEPKSTSLARCVMYLVMPVALAERITARAGPLPGAVSRKQPRATGKVDTDTVASRRKICAQH